MSDDKSLLNIEVAAKAEFRAEIKAEVPPEAVGRLVDAITDAFSPFVARQRLKASELRLQQEEVLIKLARLTNEKLRIQQQIPKPVSTKFLVPLLEKASLEDPDDNDMIERWAALLAAESAAPGANRRWAIDILASITSWQARLIETISTEMSPREFFRVERFTRNAINDEFEGTLEMAGAAVTDARPKEVVGELGGFTLFFDGRDIANTNEFEFKDLPEGADLLHLDVLGLIWLNAGSFVSQRERHFLVNAQLSPLGAQFSGLFEKSDV